MVKKYIYLLLFAVFIVFSCLFFNSAYKLRTRPAGTGQSIHFLKQITVREDHTERTDFVDADGNITMAQNLGYATVIITITDYGRVESYFDEHGNPVTGRNGYASVIYEYNEEDKKTHVRYLGKNGEPVTVRNGYAEEVREYNQKGQMTAVRYYDVYGQPAQFIYFGYGKKIEYDEDGLPYRVVYINAAGDPMMTSEGYAIVTRNYYQSDGPENGKVDSEFYFDTEGNSVCLQTGQYGLHKEYDEYGRETVLTYLDSDGNPTIITKGYATVRRIYSDNNQIAAERYYDQYGNPCSLPEGQFGIKWEDGQKVYLDANGNEQINLKNLLYKHSWAVIFIAVTVILLSVPANRPINTILLVLCLMMIIYMTLMSRNSITGQSGIRILRTYWEMIFDSEARAGVLKNIWLFIPLGAILYGLYPKRNILFIPAVLSILIETIQYFTGIGYCDLSDVVSNIIGGFAGFKIADVLKNLKISFQKKKQSVQPNP